MKASWSAPCICICNRAENMMKRLLYFGRKYSIGAFSLTPSPNLTNYSKKDKVERTICSFVDNSQIAYISVQWATFTNWSFCWPIWSLGTHWLSRAAFLLSLSIEATNAKSPWDVLISDLRLLRPSEFDTAPWYTFSRPYGRRWLF